MAKTAKVSPGRGKENGGHKDSLSLEENVTRVIVEEGDLRMILEIAGKHRLSESTRNRLEDALHQAVWDHCQDVLLPFMSVCFKLDPVRFGQ